MKRPKTIWATQIVLVLYSLLMVLLCLVNLGKILRSSMPSAELVIAVLANSIILVVVAIFMTAFWGLVKRAPYGRWLSVILLLLFLVMAILTTASGGRYKNNAQMIGATLAQLLICGGLLLLILRLVFSKKIALFFNHEKQT